MVADRLDPIVPQLAQQLRAGDLRSMPASEWGDQLGQLIEVVVQPLALSWCIDIIVPVSEVRVGIHCSGAEALSLWSAL